jgi:hypothetical protein
MNSRQRCRSLTSVDLAGDEVDGRSASYPYDGACIHAHMRSRVDAGLGRQSGAGRRNRRDTRLLVVGYDRHQVALPFLPLRHGPLPFRGSSLGDRRAALRSFFPQSRDRAVRGCALRCSFTWSSILHIVPCAKLARHAHPPAPFILASVVGKQPGRPQFVGMTEMILCLPPRQRHKP